MEYVVITQKLDCVFGHDHSLTVTIGDDKSLKGVTSTCSADREETDGLILLGTDPMKTCLGYIDCFLKHTTDPECNAYSLDNRYRKTFMFNAGTLIATTNKEKRAVREREKEAEAARIAREKGTDVVTRRLKDVLIATPGIGSATAEYMKIKKDEDTGRYTFYIGTGSKWEPSVRERVPGNWRAVATRNDGVWDMHCDWDQNERVFQTTEYYGGQCPFCHVDGRRGHAETQNHKNKLTKAMYIGLQATSKAGMALMKEELTDKQGKPLAFKYRRNAKQVMGVRLAEHAPENTSNEW